jgi:protein-disulfide isomerase-like protein with CxxC motif
MGDYFARVELHGARSKEDYDHLYNQLKVKGFYSMAVNAQGTGTGLPTGTYVSHGNYATVDLAHEAVRDAVTATGFPGSVVVVEFSQWKGSDL